MSRNSMEKRSTLVQKGWANRSRCNPESATSITISPNLPERYQKFQESNVSTRNLGIDTNSLESRYEALQKLYKGLMAKIGTQDQNVSEQSKELKRLQKVHENNEKQIKRLRGMLGFLKKQDKQTQTIQVEDHSNPRSPVKETIIKSCIHISKFSNFSSKDHSKIINTMNTTNNESQTNIASPPMHRSVPKSSNVRMSRSSKYLLNERSSDMLFKKEERCVSPGFKQRYKFIPSLPLA